MAKQPNLVSRLLLPTVYDKKTPKDIVSNLPKSRVSIPDTKGSLDSLTSSLTFMQPGFLYEYIPTIRKLLTVNSSVSSAIGGIAELANTGYEIDYGKTPDDLITKANYHLEEVTKTWGFGTPGIHGLVNRLIYQVYIGGAMSAEWVLKKDLSGVKYLAFVNPEQVRVAYDPAKQIYRFFQVPQGSLFGAKALSSHLGYTELNSYTYQYLGLISDQESPVGIPPILSALDDLSTQLRMLRNIGYVSDQMGLMGFLEILMQKPNRKDAEADGAYGKRLTDLLSEAKDNIKDGLKDGIVAGYMDDHEFEFHTPSKDTKGAADIFGIIQRMVSTGLYTDAQFLGGLSGSSETLVTVIFTKMLSQLGNVQLHASSIIERGIWFELMMNNIPVKKVELKWKPSTIVDQVKEGQTEEYKVKNSRTLYADGIISLDGYARRMGYEQADQKKPRADIDPDKVQKDSDQKDADGKKDNAADRKTRAKGKAQPKGKDDKQKSN